MNDDVRVQRLLEGHLDFLRAVVVGELRRAGLPHEHRDDVVSHVMEVVWRDRNKADNRQVPDEKWPPWLRVIARNEVRNVIRRVQTGRVRNAELTDAVAHPQDGGYDGLLDELTGADLQAIIDNLGEPERSLLTYLVWDKLDIEDVAAKLELDLPATKRLLTHLSDKVRRVEAGGTLKGPKAPGITAFTHALKRLLHDWGKR